VSGQFGSYFNGSSSVVGALTDGSNITYNGQQFLLTYTANFEGNSFTGGNDVALLAVPEPSTWAMLLGGMGMLRVWQRTRRSGKA